MALPQLAIAALPVVPRKGDVDRNTGAKCPACKRGVVPRKGDVDRNVFSVIFAVAYYCRPPQGGRG